MDVLVEQVMRDLKARGFKIVESFGNNLFTAEKKDKYLFYVMVEGVEVTIQTLLDIINMGETLSLPVVLALVSNDGSVTYYFVRKMRLPHNVYAGASARSESSHGGLLAAAQPCKQGGACGRGA